MSLDNLIHLTRSYQGSSETDDVYLKPETILGYQRRRELKTTLLMPNERHIYTLVILLDQRNLEVDQTPEQIEELLDAKKTV